MNASTYGNMLLSNNRLCGVSSWKNFVDLRKSSYIHTNETLSNTIVSAEYQEAFLFVRDMQINGYSLLQASFVKVTKYQIGVTIIL